MNKVHFLIAGLLPNLTSACILWIAIYLFYQGLIIYPIIILAFVLCDRILALASFLDQNKIYPLLFLSFLNMKESNELQFVQDLEKLYILIYYPLLIILIDLNNNDGLMINQSRIFMIFTILFSVYFAIAAIYVHSCKNEFGRPIVILRAEELISFSKIQKVALTFLLLFRCSNMKILYYVIIILCLSLTEALFYQIITSKYIEISLKEQIFWNFFTVLNDSHFYSFKDTKNSKNNYIYQISSKVTLITKSFFTVCLFIISIYSEDKKPFLWTILLQTEYIVQHFRYILDSEKVIYQINTVTSKNQIIPFIEKHLKQKGHLYIDYKKQKNQQTYQQFEDDYDLSLDEQIKLLKLLTQFKDNASVQIDKYYLTANSNFLIIHNIVSSEAVYLFLYEVENIPQIFLPPTSYLNLDFKRILINRSILQLNDDYSYSHFPNFLAIKKQIQVSQLSILIFHKLISNIFGINPSMILYDLYDMGSGQKVVNSKVFYLKDL